MGSAVSMVLGSRAQYGRRLAGELVRVKARKQLELGVARGCGTAVGEVDDVALRWPFDRGMGRVDEAGQAFR